jgi:hypothetical protein
MLLLIKEEDEHISLLHDAVNDLKGERSNVTTSKAPEDPQEQANRPNCSKMGKKSATCRTDIPRGAAGVSYP